MVVVIKGNMYEWITKTKNFMGGVCPHGCNYCFVPHLLYQKTKERYSGPLRLLEEEFQKPLGIGKLVFVEDCGDLFADAVPKEWILRVIDYCRNYDNIYLFQTKNPKRFLEFLDKFPEKTILGTTIETNRDYKITNAPAPIKRFMDFPQFSKTMISIEPIMDFDLATMVQWIKTLKPTFVSIGADSKGHKLPEPSKEKIEKLIDELKKITEVKIKTNLKRLIK